MSSSTPLITPFPPSEYTQRADRTFQIQQVIGVYEKKYRTFASLGNYEGAKHIYEMVNKIFITKLNIDLDTMFHYDYKSFLLIISALYGKKDPLDIPQTVNTQQTDTNKMLTLELKSLLRKENALHTLLIMCYAARLMIELFRKDDIVQWAKVEQYQSMKDELEDIACELINSISLSDSGFELAERALRLDYKALYRIGQQVGENEDELSSYTKYLRNKFDTSKEVLAIAFKAKARKFLCQRPCTMYMSRTNTLRWIKQIVHISFRLFYIVIFAFMLCNYPYYSSYSSVDFKSSCHLPNSNFTSDAIKRVINAALANDTCINDLFTKQGKCQPMIEQLREFARKDNWTNEEVWSGANNCERFLNCIHPKCPFYGERVSMACAKLCEVTSSLNGLAVFAYTWILFVLIAQLGTTFLKAIDYVVFYRTRIENIKMGCYKSTKKNFRLLRDFFADNSLAFHRFFLIIFFLFLDIFRHIIVQKTRKSPSEWLGWQSLIPILLELVYYALFSIVVVTSLRFFHFIPRLGFFLRLIKKMWQTVGMFVVIFISFWIVLAVVYFGITRRIDNLTSNPLHAMFSEGKFEVFGEVKDEDRRGELDNCHFNRTIEHFSEMNYDEASCLFRATIVPYIVFFYMFISGILLVNLLTAQLTKEYEEESRQSEHYAGYLRYRQLSKMDAKMLLPPPLSFLNFVWRLFWAILFWPLKLALYFYNYRYTSWVWRFTTLLDGHPWGVARDPLSQPDSDLDAAVSEYLAPKPENELTKAAKLLKEYDYEETDRNTFSELRCAVIGYLDKVEAIIRARAPSRAVETPLPTQDFVMI